jgi:hypothetical protein
MMIRIEAASVLVLAFSALAAEPISLHTFAKSGKYGFMDDDGMVRIPPRRDNALDFSEGLAGVAVISGHEVYEHGGAGDGCLVKTSKWGFIHPDGEDAIPYLYSAVRPFSEGRAAVGLGSKWGFIDTKGRWIIQLSVAE